MTVINDKSVGQYTNDFVKRARYLLALMGMSELGLMVTSYIQYDGMEGKVEEKLSKKVIKVSNSFTNVEMAKLIKRTVCELTEVASTYVDDNYHDSRDVKVSLHLFLD